MGSVWNFKFVFKKACGKYFMWASADDMWSNDWIEKLLKLHVEGVCMAFGQHSSICENDKIIFKHEITSFDKSEFIRLAKFYLYLNPQKANLLHSIFLRKLIDDEKFLHVWDGGMAINDMLPTLAAMQYGEVKYDLSAKFYKREHIDAASSNQRKKSTFEKIIEAIFPFDWLIQNLFFIYPGFELKSRLLFFCLYPILFIEILIFHYLKLLKIILIKLNIFSENK